jgi:hypothetical protein
MMKYHDEPPLEYIQQDYSVNFFPKEVQRLGDNMFLVTYTKDTKGRSNVRYRSLVYWTDRPRWGMQIPTPRWDFFGTIKRNRTWRGNYPGINIYAHDYTDDSNRFYSEAWMMDTDENYTKATNLLVAMGQIRWPEEFYDGIHCR